MRYSNIFSTASSLFGVFSAKARHHSHHLLYLTVDDSGYTAFHILVIRFIDIKAMLIRSGVILLSTLSLGLIT